MKCAVAGTGKIKEELCARAHYNKIMGGQKDEICSNRGYSQQYICPGKYN